MLRVELAVEEDEAEDHRLGEEVEVADDVLEWQRRIALHH
jgi:hypothetical protein